MSRQTYNLFKHFYLALGLGLLLSACEKHPEEDILHTSGKMIEFFPRSNTPLTKATAGHPIDGTDFPNNQSFGVYAYQVGFSTENSVELFKDPETETIAFNNTQVTKNANGEIVYAPKVRWPDFETGKSLRFFAYYPYYHPNLSVTQAPTTERVDLIYTLSGNPKEHIDLMYWMSSQIGSSADQVEVGFNHALTRLRFKARLVPSSEGGYPEGTEVQVTKIEIKNAATQGTLQVIPNGNIINADWALNTAVKTPLVLTSENGLRSDSYQIPSTSSIAQSIDLLSTGGDMLVIPQNVTGLSMEVTAIINGISRMYTYDLRKTEVQWAMNKNVTYQLAFGWNGISVSSFVSNWVETDYNVILDGQYYLKTSQTKIDVGSTGGSIPIIFETNYDGLTGYPIDLRFDLTNITNNTENAWCSVSWGENTGPLGVYQRIVTVTVDSYPQPSKSRTTDFSVCAGNLVYIIKVTQLNSSWLTITPSSPNGFKLDGSLHSFKLASNNGDWTIKSVDDPNGILLPVTEWVGSSGREETPFYFYLKGKTIPGQTAWVTVKGTDDVRFAITAVAP